MRHILLASCLSLFTLGGFAPSYADSFDVKRCVNMGNAMDAPNEGDWGHVIEADSFRRVKSAGFDTVRIPMRWSAHTNGPTNFTIKPSFFERATDVINQALAQDLNVIINIHHFEEINEKPQENVAKFLALWDQIATRYASLPSHVYFEVLNEPNGELKGDVMRSILTAGFNKIRESNPTRMLIIGGEDWSGIDSLTSLPSIDDKNQVYTFHYYDPFEFTHQKTSWTYLKDSGSKSWGSAKDKQDLKEAAAYAAKVRAETGLPIFLGEFGAYEKAPYSDIVNYTDATRKAFEGQDIPWCVWNFTATFPLFDSDTKQWDRQKLTALGLSETGVIDKNTKSVSSTLSSANTNFEGQSLDTAFNALRRKIGREGELMLAPYADQLGDFGKAKIKRVDDSGVPGGKATEIKVSRKGKNPWDSGLSSAFAGSVKAGDTLVMSYWAKAVKGPGVIAAAGIQENNAPYKALQMETPQLDEQWRQYYVTAKAAKDYKAEELSFAMQTAGAKQTLRDGPVFILNLGPGVPTLSLR